MEFRCMKYVQIYKACILISVINIWIVCMYMGHWTTDRAPELPATVHPQLLGGFMVTCEGDMLHSSIEQCYRRTDTERNIL